MISQEYFDKLKRYFDDEKKAWVWLDTPNPRLGLLTPMNAIKLGREKRVMYIIDGLHGLSP